MKNHSVFGAVSVKLFDIYGRLLRRYHGYFDSKEMSLYSSLYAMDLFFAAGHVSTELCVIADGDMVPDRHVCLGLLPQDHVLALSSPKTTPKPEVNREKNMF